MPQSKVKTTRNSAPPFMGQSKGSVRGWSRCGFLAAAACMGMMTPAVFGLGILRDDVVGNLVQVVKAREGVLNLRTGDVQMDALVNLLDVGQEETFAQQQSRVVLRLDGPMTKVRREQLREAGVQVWGYLPTWSYIADVRGTTAAGVRALGFVSGVYAYEATWRVDTLFLGAVQVDGWRTEERAALAARGLSAANIWLFEGLEAEQVEGFSQHLQGVDGCSVIEQERVGAGYRIGIHATHEAIRGLSDAAQDISGLIQYIEPHPEYVERSNSTLRWVVQSGTNGATPLYDRGLTGSGQVIGVIDGGLSATHCAFTDLVNPIGPLHRKILAYNTAIAYNLHGTHVSGTAAGNAGVNNDTRGVAYDSKIVFNVYPSATEASQLERYELHHSQGAFIHNNSWGTDSTRSYDGGCRGIDRFQWENEDNLILHAVSDGSIVTNPENAKNSLAVSASQNGTNLNNWSIGGIGPTLDGRRKPEVLAPGSAIISTAGNGGCGTTSLTGTSMSTPAVSGLAALVRQYYTLGFYPSGAANAGDAMVPSGSLLKATLINSAQDMTGVEGYPSHREGWGRVQANAALSFAGANPDRNLLVRDIRNSSDQALATGNTYSLDIEVLSSAKPLRVTMVYCDVPAQVNATVTLVNDLQLEISSPSGVTYRGNVFESGFSVSGGEFDSLNNTEQVHVAGPDSGRWSVRVIGANVAEQMQGFALVMTGDISIATCRADFNLDGGVDGQDIEVFFTIWSQGEPPADINLDGGVDGNDIEAFFGYWEAGC